MKKLLLSLLLIANSLFAITLAEIDLGTHPRAYITQVDIRDSKETEDPVPLYGTKLNTTTYPNWYSSYPYDSLKYSGEITSWVYTFDYANFYYYSTFWDAYINQNDLSRTYIYVNLQGYSINNVKLYKYEGGQKSIVPSVTFDGYTYPRNIGNGYYVYLNTNSSAVGSYRAETFIQATDGSVILGNSVRIDRNTQ